MSKKRTWRDFSIIKIIMNEFGEAGDITEAVIADSGDAGEASPEGGEVIEASGEENAVIESEDSGAVEVQAESEQELEGEIKEAIEGGATEEEVKDMIRSFTLKVNGREFEKEIDLSDEDALKKEFQMAHAGRQSMQELAEIKKMYSSELSRLKENPLAVLKELDPDFDALKLSSDYIEKYLKEQEMSPEDKAKFQRDSEYDQMKAELEAMKKEREDKNRSEELSKLEAEIESDIMSAIDADPELVADSKTLELIANELYWASMNGYEDYSAKDVIPQVKKQLREDFRSAAGRFKNMDILKDYMGSELLDKLKADRIEQAKTQLKTIDNLKETTTKAAKKEDKKLERIPLSSLFK